MLDLLPLGLLALCLWRLRFAKPLLSGMHEDNLSRESAASLRGLLALVVIFSHLNIWRSGGFIFPWFGKVGNLTVSVFFFLSGYGLQKQHMSRENYARGFLKKRLLTVALPYVLATALYWVYYLWLGREYTLLQVVTSLFRGNPIAAFSWYILASLSFYVGFWLIMVSCRKRYGAMVLCTLLWYGLYTAFCVMMNYGTWWYISAFAAVLGVAWAVYEQPLRPWLERNYSYVLICAVLALIGMVLLSRQLSEVPVAGQISNVAEAAVFASCVILITFKLSPGNPVSKFLGQLSMELYLMHGLAMMLWNNSLVRIKNDLLYCLLVLVTSVVLALILHIAFKGMPNKKPTR